MDFILEKDETERTPIETALYELWCHVGYEHLAEEGAKEIIRLRSALETIAFPRRGTDEWYWNISQIGEFAALALTTPSRPTLHAVDAATGAQVELSSDAPPRN